MPDFNAQTESFPVKDYLASLSKFNKRYATFSGGLTASTVPELLQDVPQAFFLSKLL